MAIAYRRRRSLHFLLFFSSAFAHRRYASINERCKKLTWRTWLCLMPIPISSSYARSSPAYAAAASHVGLDVLWTRAKLSTPPAGSGGGPRVTASANACNIHTPSATSKRGKVGRPQGATPTPIPRRSRPALRTRPAAGRLRMLSLRSRSGTAIAASPREVQSVERGDHTHEAGAARASTRVRPSKSQGGLAPTDPQRPPQTQESRLEQGPPARERSATAVASMRGVPA